MLLEKNAFKKEYFWKRMYLKCLEKSVIQFNPIPTRLCHVIYCHGDKSYPCLVGLGLRKPSIFFVGTVEICMSLIIDQWPKQNLGFDAQPEI